MVDVQFRCPPGPREQDRCSIPSRSTRLSGLSARGQVWRLGPRLGQGHIGVCHCGPLGFDGRPSRRGGYRTRRPAMCFAGPSIQCGYAMFSTALQCRLKVVQVPPTPSTLWYRLDSNQPSPRRFERRGRLPPSVPTSCSATSGCAARPSSGIRVALHGRRTLHLCRSPVSPPGAPTVSSASRSGVTPAGRCAYPRRAPPCNLLPPVFPGCQMPCLRRFDRFGLPLPRW